MRVVVVVGVVADHPTQVLQVGDDPRVGVEDVLAGPLGHVVGEAALVVDRHHERDAGLLADPLVVLAEAGGQVHHAGALAGVDEVGAEDPEGVGGLREVVEQGLDSGARPTRHP